MILNDPSWKAVSVEHKVGLARARMMFELSAFKIGAKEFKKLELVSVLNSYTNEFFELFVHICDDFFTNSIILSRVSDFLPYICLWPLLCLLL